MTLVDVYRMHTMQAALFTTLRRLDKWYLESPKFMSTVQKAQGAIFGVLSNYCHFNNNYPNLTMTTRASVPMTFPAADRNKQPLLEALKTILPHDGQQIKVLELASGTTKINLID